MISSKESYITEPKILSKIEELVDYYNSKIKLRSKYRIIPSITKKRIYRKSLLRVLTLYHFLRILNKNPLLSIKRTRFKKVEFKSLNDSFECVTKRLSEPHKGLKYQLYLKGGYADFISLMTGRELLKYSTDNAFFYYIRIDAKVEKALFRELNRVCTDIRRLYEMSNIHDIEGDEQWETYQDLLLVRKGSEHQWFVKKYCDVRI